MFKSSKKILAWFLAVLMIVSALPLTSFAWDYTLTYVKRDFSWNNYSNKFSASLHDGGTDYVNFVLEEVDKDGVITVKKGSGFKITLNCGKWTSAEGTNGYPPNNNIGWHFGSSNSTSYCISSLKNNSVAYWTAYRANDNTYSAIQSGISGTIANQGGQDAYRSRPENGGSRDATGIWEFTPSSFPELYTTGTYQIKLNPTIALTQYKTTAWWAIGAWGNAEGDRTRVIPVTVKVVEDFKFVKANGATTTVQATNYEEALESAPANSNSKIVYNNNDTHTVTNYSWPETRDSAASGTQNVNFYTTIYNGTNSRGDDNKMVICSDGQADNTTAGILKFNIDSFSSKVTSAKLNLNFETLGFTGEKLNVVSIASNKDVTISPSATGRFSAIYKSTFATGGSSASYNDVMSYFGASASDVVASLSITKNQGASNHEIDITSLVNKAKSQGESDLYFLLAIPNSGDYNSANSNGWSDITVRPNATNISWRYDVSTAINEIASDVITNCSGADRVIKAATCSESGQTDRTCEICGNVKTTITDPTGKHKEEVIKQVNPTCTTEGSTQGVKCSDCGIFIVEPQPIAMKAHKISKVAANVATCTQAGNNEYWECSTCHQFFSEEDAINVIDPDSVIIPSTGEHKGGTATCEQPPVCDMCNQPYGEALGHAYVDHEAQEPTCINKGWYAYKTCSREGCDYSTKVEIAATGNHTGGTATCKKRAVCSICGNSYGMVNPNNHFFETYVSEGNATCKTDGTKVAYCSYGCGKSDRITDVDSHLTVAHTEQVVKGYDSTCTVPGKSDGKICSVCGVTLEAQQDLVLASHVDNDNDNLCDACGATMCLHPSTTTVGAKETSCKEPGYTGDVVCDVCHTMVTKGTEIAQLNHTIETLEAVDATCTEDGKTEGKKCSVCQTVLVEQQKVDALGHVEVKTEINRVEADCHNPGSYVEVVTCSRCHNELSRTDKVISKLQHIEKLPANENVITATCTVKGEYDIVVRCQLCGDILSSNHITGEKLPHTPSDISKVTIAEASCSQAGSHYEIIECTVCHNELSKETIIDPKLPHTDKNNDRICDVCGGETCIHPDDYGEWVVINPNANCQQEYIERATCKICGQTEDRNTGRYGKHIYTTGSDTKVYFAATCTYTGLSCHYCKLCDDLNTETDTIVIPKLQHNFLDDVVENAATCTSSEIISNTCADCGTKVTKYGKAPVGHNGVWTVTKEATCAEEGTNSLVCDRCQTLLSEKAIEKVPHKIVIDKAVPSTCTSEGLSKGSHCSVCSEILIEQVVIPTSSHTDLNADGICDDCSAEFNHAIPEHNCLCHKEGGFYKLIYKIAVFVWKLLGKNQVCACGELHYGQEESASGEII